MAERPWVFPKEVIAYTDYESVKVRSEEKLKVDIARAEKYVISYTNNSFLDKEYKVIPDDVKTAIILIAEVYAYYASLGTKRHNKSESFDDYSYTREDAEASITDLGIGALLDDYIIVKPKGAVTMKLRKL